MKSLIYKKLSCNKGMTIIQVLVSAVVMMTIIYGIISMLMFSARQQQKQNMHSTLVEMQKNVYELLSDSTSWQKTYNSNLASFACIAAGCAVGSKNMILDIHDSSDAVVLSNLPNDWANPTFPSGGFNDRGIKCAGFDGAPGFGNDQCPFTYKIVWEPMNSAPNPAFRITARLLYNPGTTFSRTVIQLGHATNLLPVDSFNIGKRPTILSAFTGNLNQVLDSDSGKYDVTIWRTVTSNVPTFRAVSQASGVCDTFTPKPRGGWSKSSIEGGYDPYEVISIQGNKIISINTPGTYECEVIGTANGVDAFSVSLTRIPGAPIAASPPVPAIPAGLPLSGASSAGFAANGRQSTAQVHLSFQHLNVNDRYEVRQQCALDKAPPPSPANQALGLKLPGVALASVTCRLINPN